MNENILMNKLYIIFRNLFGEDLIKSKQQSKKKFRYYYLNLDLIDKEKTLYHFRHPCITTCVLDNDETIENNSDIKIKPKIKPKIIKINQKYQLNSININKT